MTLPRSISVRRYRVPEAPDLAALASLLHPCIPLSQLPAADESRGWCHPSNFLRDAPAPGGSPIFLALRTDTRVISAALVKAHMDNEVSALRAAGERVGKRQRDELKESIRERLHELAPIRTSVVRGIWDTDARILYVLATGDAACDRMISAIRSDGAGPREIHPAQSGREFLTWMWWDTEMGVGTPGLLVFGTVELEADDDATILRGDASPASVEAGAALRSGKTPRRVRFLYVDGDRESTFTLDDRLQLRGLRLPTPEADDPGDIFAEQFEALVAVCEIVDLAFARFSALEGSALEAAKAKMAEWIQTKGGAK